MKKITLMLLAALFAVVTRAADPVVPPSTATVETWYTVDGSFYISSSTWIEYTQNMTSINVAIGAEKNDKQWCLPFFFFLLRHASII